MAVDTIHLVRKTFSSLSPFFWGGDKKSNGNYIDQTNLFAATHATKAILHLSLFNTGLTYTFIWQVNVCQFLQLSHPLATVMWLLLLNMPCNTRFFNLNFRYGFLMFCCYVLIVYLPFNKEKSNLSFVTIPIR